MRRLFVLSFCALACAWVSCSGGNYDPLYRPDPIVDNDPYSRLSRAARAHNQGVEQGADEPTLQESSAAVLSLIDEILANEQPDEDLTADLAWLRAVVEANPTGHVPMHPVAWIAAQGHTAERDTLYVMYGYGTQVWVESEKSQLRALALALNLRGYRLVSDGCTNESEWYSFWERRDAIGVIWRSHGWMGLSVAEDADPIDVVSRVWSGNCETKRKQLFADHWAQVLPEGLVLVVMATCGGGGVMIPESVNDLDYLGEPEALRYFTFHTELDDRTVFSRSHVGYLVGFPYLLETLSWKAATEMLPPRAHLNPDLVTDARGRLVERIKAGGHWMDWALTVLAPLSVEDWFPVLVGELQGNESSEAGPSLNQALSTLAAILSGSDPGLQTAAEWSAWWESDPVRAARDDAVQVETTRPAEGWLWVRLVSDFSNLTGYYRGVPRIGTDLTEYCWERWFRCQVSKIGRWQLNQDGVTMNRQVGAGDETGCGGPLSLPFSVTFDPADRSIDHNLAEVIGTVSSTEVRDLCADRE